MAKSRDDLTIREAVGVFDDGAHLQAAIDALSSAGFDRAELSLLASGRAVDEKLHRAYRKVEELEDDARVPRTAYVSTEEIGEAEGALIGSLMYVGAIAAVGGIVASGGTLAGAIVAAALAGGAGGVTGSILAKLVEHHHADHLQDQLAHGGMLLWVRTRDPAHEARAREILTRHGARDVHVHDIAGAAILHGRPGVSDLEKALLDPSAVFATPEEVLGRGDLSTEQKVLVLRRWAHDARELEVADDEGMPPGPEPDLLSRVLDALRTLGTSR